jgi:hypothetical protein
MCCGSGLPPPGPLFLSPVRAAPFIIERVFVDRRQGMLAVNPAMAI